MMAKCDDDDDDNNNNNGNVAALVCVFPSALLCICIF